MNLKIKFFIITLKILLLSNNTENYPVVTFINKVVKKTVEMIATDADNFEGYSHMLCFQQLFLLNG